MKKLLLLLALLILAPGLALAKPDASVAKEVLDYYLKGSEVVLLEYNFCASIQNTQCIDPVDPTALAKGSEAYLWMNFMVPKTVKSILFIQFKYKERTMLTSDDVTLQDSIGYRTWIQVPTDKIGDWDVVVEQERAQRYQGITTLAYSVK